MIQANHHPFRIAFRELQREMLQERVLRVSLAANVFVAVFFLLKRGAR